MELLTREATPRATRKATSLRGERSQLHFLVAFAAVYGLSDADITTVGTAATELRHGLLISNFQLGTLVAVTTAVGALTTLPAGALADRVKRVPLLAWSVALWAVAMGASALATSYAMLLATRVLLGGLLAVNGPVTASLLGDLWPAKERGRVYGLVTSGELLGAGAGFFAAGELAALSWRLAFGVLALPAVVLAWSIWRLPEPQRTTERIASTPAVAYSPATASVAQASYVGPPAAPPLGDRRDSTKSAGATSEDGLGAPCATLPDSFPGVVAYVLRIKTNVVLIVAGGLTWVFLSAAESFGEEFAKEQYHLGQVLATIALLVVGLGAVVGATASGGVSDALVRRGFRAGRMTTAAGATVLSAAAFVPALLTGKVFVALPLLAVSASGLASANPPIDAARLEVVPSWIWGRAEAVRSVLRMSFQAAAPLLVGFLADTLAGGGRRGLQLAFLSMLVLLLAAGVLLLSGHRTYPADRARAIDADCLAATGRTL